MVTGSDANYSLNAGDILGQYQVISQLGRGGMGEVYLAENVHNHTRCALKVLPPGLSSDPQFIKRFMVEARVMAELNHRHIVRVHHMAEEGGRYFLTMDYIADAGGEPRTLEDELAEHERLPEETVRLIALQICSALSYAHGREVVHRDLKPSNILLGESTDSSDPFVFIADFGLVKVLGADFMRSVVETSARLTMARSMGDQPTEGAGTSTESMLGTFEYLSPEQKSGGEVDARSDIYSLGLILYRLLTGERPEGRWKPPSTFGGSAKWDRIIEKCLERLPEERYSSAEALQADIEALGRKKRPGAGLVASVAAVAGIFFLAGWWLTIDRSGNQESEDARESTDVVVPDTDLGNTPQTTGDGSVSFLLNVQPPGARVVLTQQGQPVHRVEAMPAAGEEVTLLPGSYALMASLDGYRPLHQDFDVSAQMDPLDLQLSELTGVLEVHSDPEVTVLAQPASGADAIEIGRTDEQGNLDYEGLMIGDYDLVLLRADYSTVTSSVEIVESKPVVVNQRLVGIPGRLEVFASRELEVWEGDHELGSSGEVIRGLPAGTHRLELKRRGFRTIHQEVEIPPNGYASVRIDEMVNESGSLRVSVRSSVTEDDWLAGLTGQIRVAGGSWKPFSVTEGYTEQGLSCEEQAVEVEVAGYATSSDSSVPQKVRIVDDKTTNLVLVLEPNSSRLTVNSSVPDAQVYSGENLLGKADKPIVLEPFVKHELELRADGFKGRKFTMRLERPGDSFLSKVITLEKWSGLEPGKPWRISDLGMELLPVGRGSFQMGSGDSDSDKDERPVHTVRIGYDFWLGKTEVTQSEYAAVMGKSPSDFKGDKNPVDTVSWNDAVAVCGKLTDRERAEGRIPEGWTYRLPTEAEWEYAARGGTKSKGFKYAGSNKPGEVAWFADNSGKQTHLVGRKRANELGLHDMSGNVWEWCEDVYVDSYEGTPTDGSAQTSGGSHRVIRGGSWSTSAYFVRSSNRYRSHPSIAGRGLGFRVCLGRSR